MTIKKSEEDGGGSQEGRASFQLLLQRITNERPTVSYLGCWWGKGGGGVGEKIETG